MNSGFVAFFSGISTKKRPCALITYASLTATLHVAVAQVVGMSSTNCKVGGLIPACSSLHVIRSLGKMLNFELLPDVSIQA